MFTTRLQDKVALKVRPFRINYKASLNASQGWLTVTQSKLLNDSGNWVEDGCSNVVVLSTKFLADNKLTESEAVKNSSFNRCKTVAFIETDEQGAWERADGVVRLCRQNTLVINSYPEIPTMPNNLKADLSAAFPM